MSMCQRVTLNGEGSLEVYLDEHRSFSKGIYGIEQRMIALRAMNK